MRWLKICLIANCLLVWFVACTVSPTTAPQPSPSIPTPIAPTLVPTQTNQPTVAPSATLAPTEAPAATTSPPTLTPTTSNEGLLPSNAVWVVVDNVVFAAAPSTPQLILGTDPHALNLFAMQVAADGSRIAYTLADQQGLVQFKTVDTRTGAQQQYSHTQNTMVVGPRFSPDSQRLAYTMIDQSGAQAVWQLQVLGPRVDDVKILQRFVPSSPNDHLKPLSPMAWTPNGLYVEELLWNSDAPPHGITRVNPENGELQTINDAEHLRAEISPDGKRAARMTGILPMGPDVDSKVTLAILDLETGQEQELAQDAPFWISILRWSPDSQRVLYTKQSGGSGLITALVVSAADGSDERTLPIGGAGGRGLLRDAAWRDNDSLLLLVADNENTLHLYELALENLTPDALQEIANFSGPRAEGTTPRILYVPR